MRTKSVLILVAAVVFIFSGAGISMAKDWKGGQQNYGKGHAYGHHKQDKQHKFDPKRLYAHRPVVKRPHYHHPKPVVVHHHHYNSYVPYSYYVGQFIGFSFIDPNVAFSIAVRGH